MREVTDLVVKAVGMERGVLQSNGVGGSLSYSGVGSEANACRETGRVNRVQEQVLPSGGVQGSSSSIPPPSPSRPL